MKIMLIDDKTTDVVTKLKDLKRRYHHVQVVNMTENESYRNGFPGEYLMYRIAGIRLRPATYLNDLPFKPEYAMSYNKYGEISVTDMGNEVATLQLVDWQKQTVRAVKYIARGFNWQFDLVGEKADVVKRWIRDDKQRTIMIRMQLSNGKLLKKLYNYEGDSQQPISMTFMYDGNLFDDENSRLTAFFKDVFDDQNIALIRYTGQ